MTPSPTLTDDDIAFLRGFVRAHCSISLDESKGYLLESRLRPVATQLGLGSPRALAALLRSSATTDVTQAVVDAVTTNETSWLRDDHPWDGLLDVALPAIAAARPPDGPITVWSAACSSGQEPYTVAMLVTERRPDIAARLRIVATDISRAMVARTSAATYDRSEMARGLPDGLRARFTTEADGRWTVCEPIRRMVETVHLDLTRPGVAFPRADVVLLRNVLIYFDLDVKRRVLDGVRRVLAPDGWLLVGASEPMISIDERWSRHWTGRTTLYRP